MLVCWVFPDINSADAHSIQNPMIPRWLPHLRRIAEARPGDFHTEDKDMHVLIQ